MLEYKRITPAIESSSPTEPQLCLGVVDADQEWGVRDIIGKEDVNGKQHYWVDWRPTLLPEHSLGQAKDLVDKFEARLTTQRRFKNGRGRLGSEPGRSGVRKGYIGRQQQKRPRGRPRKQT
jgi:hypothetical protein